MLLGALIVACAATAMADDSQSLSPNDVVSVMATRRVAIRKKCYEDSPEKADASMKIDFSIAPAGVVTDAIAREVTGPQSIADCVLAEVHRTTFPSSNNGGRFRWPFIFKGP